MKMLKQSEITKKQIMKYTKNASTKLMAKGWQHTHQDDILERLTKGCITIVIDHVRKLIYLSTEKSKVINFTDRDLTILDKLLNQK